MIWTIRDVSGFLPAVITAGDPDQTIIDAYLAHTQRPQHVQKHTGIKRYYCFLREDPRIVIACLGMPLDSWRGGALAKIGTREIIGEFPRNRHLIGKKGLQIQLSPIAWLKERADQQFQDAHQALAAISAQILDLDQAQRIQRTIQQKYYWKK